MNSSLNLNLCGSTFTLGCYQIAQEDPWPIEWLIMHLDQKYAYGISRYILDLLAFDAAEPLSNGLLDPRREFGNNHYGLSNIRQWLNSDAKPGKWYHPQHEFDAAPEYVDRPGFLYYWSDEEKSLLQDMKLKVEPNVIDGKGKYSVKDKVWLPTEDQLYDDAANPLNDYFNYFNSEERRQALLHPSLQKVYASKKSLDTYTAWGYRIDHYRYYTASSVVPFGGSSEVVIVNSDGVLNTTAANRTDIGIRPCIKIKKSNLGL